MRIEVVVLGCKSSFSSADGISDQAEYSVQLYYRGENGKTNIVVAEGVDQIEAMNLACRKMLHDCGVELNGTMLAAHYLNVTKNSETALFRYDLQWNFANGKARDVKMSVGEDKDLPIAILKAIADFFGKFQNADIKLAFRA